MADPPPLPDHFKPFIDVNADNVREVVSCRKCGRLANDLRPAHDLDPGTVDADMCFEFACPDASCEGSSWYVCPACRKIYSRLNRLQTHLKGSQHKKNMAKLSSAGQASNPLAPPPQSTSTNEEARLPTTPARADSTRQPFPGDHDGNETISFDAMVEMSDVRSCEGSCSSPAYGDTSTPQRFATADFFERVQSRSDNYADNESTGNSQQGNPTNDRIANQEANDVMNKNATKGKHDNNISNPYKLPPRLQRHMGDAWLRKVMEPVPKAEKEVVYNILDQLCGEKMAMFWCAEHVTPDEFVGGGVQYLVARAFQQTKRVNETFWPAYPEAEFHLKNFIHVSSLSAKQAEKHAHLMALMHKEFGGSTGNSLLQQTHIPCYREMRKIYGPGGGEHSIWNNVPIPRVMNVDNIAYVDIKAIFQFAFVNSIQMDNVQVSAKTRVRDDLKDSEKVFHVSDCAEVRSMMKLQVEALHDENDSYRILVCWACDWRDGFSSNKTKQNRKSVLLLTWTFSPPKDSVNGISNSFPACLGPKKSKGWPEVEHRIQQDTACFGDPSNPLYFYHGGLKKVVPVFIKRIASLEDKPERADVTATVNSSSSNQHKCFGKLVHIATPKTYVTKVEKYKREQKREESAEVAFQFGWCDDMIEKKVNGARLPACIRCRLRRVRRLANNQHSSGMNLNGASCGSAEVPPLRKASQFLPTCELCADWSLASNMPSAGLLHFPPPEDYPNKYAPGGPPAPDARPVPAHALICPNTGKQKRLLPVVDFTFTMLKQAARFAFYNISQDAPKNRWTKEKYRAYAQACGFPGKLRDELWEVAVKLRDGETDVPVDYSSETHLSLFKFPAAWVDKLELRAYIELAMHQFFLGIVQSNFELASMWLKNMEADATFRRNCQPLLSYIGRFHLSWALTHPFSESSTEKGALGTGPWVSENWIVFVRLAKLLYLFCGTLKPKKGSSPIESGFDNLMRVVISQTAMISRIMTHAGVSRQDTNELGDYIKEHLSCVRELDILVRYRKMAQLQKQQSDNTSAFAAATDAVVAAAMASNPSNQDCRPGTTSTLQHGQQQQEQQERHPQERPEKAPPSKKRKTNSKKVDPNKPDRDDSNAWWVKPNYISLLNIVAIILLFGPLVNWWDGGGKGEKFIQVVKPLLKRGVRDVANFFVRLMERLYKLRQLDLFQDRYVLFQELLAERDADENGYGDGDGDDNDGAGEYYIDDDGNVRCVDPLQDFLENGTSINFDPTDNQQDEPDLQSEGEPATVDYSRIEDTHMAKSQTIYVYAREELLKQALEQYHPICGILLEEQESSGPALQFYAVFRRSDRKSFGWYKIIFDDKEGIAAGGIWFAPVQHKDATASRVAPSSVPAIQGEAKMSAIAIPIWYAIGLDKPDSLKFCVVTNWWKERTADGRYTVPGLDSSFYKRSDEMYEEDDESSTADKGDESSSVASRGVL